jgi:hypothetical protein
MVIFINHILKVSVNTGKFNLGLSFQVVKIVQIIPSVVIFGDMSIESFWSFIELNWLEIGLELTLFLWREQMKQTLALLSSI